VVVFGKVQTVVKADTVDETDKKVHTRKPKTTSLIIVWGKDASFEVSAKLLAKVWGMGIVSRLIAREAGKELVTLPQYLSARSNLAPSPSLLLQHAHQWEDKMSKNAGKEHCYATRKNSRDLRIREIENEND